MMLSKLLFALVAVSTSTLLSAVHAACAPQTTPAAPAFAGYLFVYFTGEGTATGEQVYMAISKTNSPIGWDLLNGGNPILTTAVGQKGVRDPFIFRSASGNKFYIISTDMRAFSQISWDDSQRHGSRNILVWESNNLVNWTGPALREVMGPEAGNVWAPAAVYNTKTSKYDIVFASSIFDQAKDPNHKADFAQRQVKVSTADFVTYDSVDVTYMYNSKIPYIDTTFLKASDGKLYRFTKNEGGVNATTNPDGKMVFQMVSSDGTATGTWTNVVTKIGANWISAGEGPEGFQDNIDSNKYWLFIDEFGGRGYLPFVTTNIAAGAWSLAVNNDATTIANAMPSNHARHGSILKLTQAEYTALRKLVKS
ncbi:putative arabinase [Cladochytrium replicatum]|nr:putative arabinase [Cladochytrium replicatum]